MKLKTILILSVLTLFFISCSGSTATSKKQDELKGFKLPQKIMKDKVLVYITRNVIDDTMPRETQSDVNVNPELYLDEIKPENKIGMCGINKYIYFYTTPGKHKVIARAKNTGKVSFKAKAGEIVFIQYRVTSKMTGIIPAFNIANENDGKYAVMKTKPGTMEKIDFTK